MSKTKIIAAGGLVTNEKGELLMIYRRGKWDLPKGKLDEGETIEACALREVEEETGITGIRLGRLIEIGYHEYFDNWTNTEVVKETHWYAMQAPRQALTPQTEEDITDIQWVNDADLAERLENTYPNIIDIIHKSRK